jgi:hypothetical protein
MKIYIDTTADPKNALIASQADSQAATMLTLFHGDVLPLQIMFTDGSGNPAEFSGQANNEVIFAIGVLVPHQTYVKTEIMNYANNSYYADLDLNTIGLENALAGNESINLIFEIQLNNGVGQSKTLAQGDCTVRNQLNLFSAINSTLPAAPSVVSATDSTPETVPDAPSIIQITQTNTNGQLLILQDFTYGGFSGTANQVIDVLSWVGQRPYVAKSNGQELLPVSLKNTHWEIYSQNVLNPSSPTNITILENKPYIVYGNDGTNGLGYYYPVYLYNFGLEQYHTHNFGDRIVTGNWENNGNISIIGEFLTVLQTQDNGGRQYRRSDGSKIWSNVEQYNNLTIAAQNYYMESTAVNHAATYPTNTNLEIAPGTQLITEVEPDAPSDITALSVFSNSDIGREIIILPGSGLLSISWATLQIGNIYTTTNIDENSNRIGFLDDNSTFVWVDDATKVFGRQLGVDWEFKQAETQTPVAPSGITLESPPTAPSVPTMQFKSVLIGFEATGLIDSRITGYYQKINEFTFENLNNNYFTTLNIGTNKWDFYYPHGGYVNGFSQDSNVLNVYSSEILINETYYTASELPTAPSGITLEGLPTAPSGITLNSEAQTPATLAVFHGEGGVYDSTSRSRTDVSTSSSDYTDIQAMTYSNGTYYRVYIPLPKIPNTEHFQITYSNSTSSTTPGTYDKTYWNAPQQNYGYMILDGGSKPIETGLTVIRINWLDSSGEPIVFQATLRLNLIN